MFEAVFHPEARAARDSLDADERADVVRIINLIEINPWTDDVTKFTVVLDDIGFGVYDDGRWEVVYRIVDDRFIEVIGIARIRG